MISSTRSEVDVLVSKLARDKEESALEDAQGRRGRDGVKVLDLEREHLLVLVLDRHLEQVAVLGLEQEEEVSLEDERAQGGDGSAEHFSRKVHTVSDAPSSCA